MVWQEHGTTEAWHESRCGVTLGARQGRSLAVPGSAAATAGAILPLRVCGRYAFWLAKVAGAAVPAKRWLSGFIFEPSVCGPDVWPCALVWVVAFSIIDPLWPMCGLCMAMCESSLFYDQPSHCVAYVWPCVSPYFSND